MSYYGSHKIDDYLVFAANTHDPNTGAGIDADSAPTYRIYEDEDGTAIATGTMAKLDDDNTVGFYSEQIQLTAVIGYEKGKTYHIHIAATVGGVAGSISHDFQMEAEVDANTVSGTVATVTNVGTVTGNVNGSVGSVSGAVGSVSSGVTLANDAVSAAALKTDAITEIVNAIFAKTGITAGGSASYEDLIKALYAMARGKITKSGDAYTYFDDDGTTELFTLTISSSERATS